LTETGWQDNLQQTTGHVVQKELPMESEMLASMFAMQEQLNERIGVRCADLNEEEQQQWLLNYCRAMSQELAELTDSVPWKWWADYQQFDRQNARVEVIDLFHFLISLAQVLGMSAQDVHDLYMKKNQVNFDRQESGYTEKDESDNQGLVTGS
jgi:dimeric dUTPase (all-alpha-NTP-PPase superfamily)